MEEAVTTVAGSIEGCDTPSLATRKIPICVDLDGTLIRTDILYESLLALLRLNALYVFLLPFWLLKGKAYVKSRIAQRVDLDVTLLPYNETFLSVLREQHSHGRSIVLATASDKKFATRIAEHLGIFDDVIASEGDENLSGIRKGAKLIALYGEQGFDYAGNSRADLKIWPHAQQAILVQPERGIGTAAKRLSTDTVTIQDKKASTKSYLDAMRLHQWMKNVLIFVPLTAAHQFGVPVPTGQAALAFLAFGLCASSTYLLNDMLDLQTDRTHPRKRLRPFASGTIPIAHGAFLVPMLLATALGTTLLLPLEFAIVLVGYFAITLGYSLGLKRVMVLDVLVLATLYTIRVIAGGAAVSVKPSFWLLAFSMFLFLSLAIVKRYSELGLMQTTGKDRVQGRAYGVVDLQALLSLGTASGYLSVLVFALYINSNAIRSEYVTPEALWLACPLLLYWISRVWILTQRGDMHDDPVIFTLQDRASILTMILVGSIFVFASYYEY